MKRLGRGIACGIYTLTVPFGSNPCGAFVQIKEDGSVIVQTGACDIGQGSTTVIAQMAADALGTTIDKVTVSTADTEVTPYDIGSIGSRLTFVAGNAVFRAINDAKQAIAETVAKQLKVPVDRIDFSNDKVYYIYDPDKFIPLAQAAQMTHWVERKLPIGKGVYFPHNIPLDENSSGEPCDTYSYHTTVAEVEVDDETGEVTVLKMYVCLDGGRIINPLLCRGQQVGGALQGLGWALTENLMPFYPSVDGNYADYNPDFQAKNFAEYSIPTTMDMPDYEVFYTDTIEPAHAFGARGIGEIVATTGAPAIANAIYDAVGVRVSELPITSEKILKLLAIKNNK